MLKNKKKSAGSFIKFNRKAILLLGVVVSLGIYGLVTSHSGATGSSLAPKVGYPLGGETWHPARPILSALHRASIALPHGRCRSMTA